MQPRAHSRARHVAATLSAVALSLAACSPDYSPNTYNSAAVQQTAKVEPGVIAGVRQVDVSAAGTVGAATGGAAGGIAGAQTPGGVGSAFGALGGALVGGLVGSAVEKSSAAATAYEYIVRKPNGDLVSVTQQDPAPLQIGQKVLVFDGKQARIVPDYTVPATPAAPKPGTPVGITSTVPTSARIETAPLAPPTARAPGGTDEVPLLTPVPPPPLTPGVPTPLAPPVSSP
jgi:outer membrane lipoprotein SlyB